MESITTTTKESKERGMKKFVESCVNSQLDNRYSFIHGFMTHHTSHRRLLLAFDFLVSHTSHFSSFVRFVDCTVATDLGSAWRPSRGQHTTQSACQMLCILDLRRSIMYAKALNLTGGLLSFSESTANNLRHRNSRPIFDRVVG